MTLLFTISTILVITGFLFYRDRQYLKKDRKDVLSEDAKRYLNFKTPQDAFPQQLANKTEKSRLSLEIIKEFNDSSNSSQT